MCRSVLFIHSSTEVVQVLFDIVDHFTHAERGWSEKGVAISVNRAMCLRLLSFSSFIPRQDFLDGLELHYTTAGFAENGASKLWFTTNTLEHD
jgi:hypothetical protein